MPQENPFNNLYELCDLLANMDRAKVISEAMHLLMQDLGYSEKLEDFLYMFTLLEEKVINKLPEAYELSHKVIDDMKQHQETCNK